MKTVLILGSGYVGQSLATRLKSADPDLKIIETHRSDFDLSNEKSWKIIPEADLCFWTFPAEPLQLVKSFLDISMPKWGRTIVIGTTSSLQTRIEDELVNEATEISVTDARAQGEREICARGGICVRAAGIYGPKRNPVDWVRKGLVGASSKFVNFIHLEDLVSILIAASERGESGRSYLAADSQPRRWNVLIEIFKKNYGLTEVLGACSSRPSKQIDATKTLQQLSVKLKFASVEEGVKSLES